MHKGFKCLDISTGRVYISRDVIFDENVFPFASLHPNAGARLHAEILLLSPELLNPSDHGGECSADDHVFNNPNPATNGGCAEKNSKKNSTSDRHFMQHMRPNWTSAGHEADSPGVANPERFGGGAEEPDTGTPPTPPGAPGAGPADSPSARDTRRESPARGGDTDTGGSPTDSRRRLSGPGSPSATGNDGVRQSPGADSPSPDLVGLERTRDPRPDRATDEVGSAVAGSGSSAALSPPASRTPVIEDLACASLIRLQRIYNF